MADFTISSYVNSLRMFLDAKYFPPPSLDGPKGKEIDENLSGLLTFFATKTAAKRAANVIPVNWC